MTPEAQVGRAVSLPSVGAITYQACALIRELELINSQEFLPQACRIRDVLLCIVEYVRDQLWEIQTAAGTASKEDDLARVRKLSDVLHEIFSYIRFLRASSPRQSPPGIQVALAQLTDRHFPKENGEPVCLVRPQWKYNLTYVPMSWYLRALLSRSVLDPNGNLGADNPEEIFAKLWEKRARVSADDGFNSADLNASGLPSQLAILSFAGLDTHDALLYPLLAHELGHFIDFSYDPPLHLRDPLPKSSQIRDEQVAQALEKALGPTDPTNVSIIRNRLVQQTFVSLREILADLLATRMLGFAFFVAQAEFLKTLTPWLQAAITPSGYPGIKFRLSIILNHLTAEGSASNVLGFFSQSRGALPAAAELLKYLQQWSELLAAAEPSGSTADKLTTELTDLVETAVRNSLPDLENTARKAIPDERCAKLSPTFFERITRLAKDLPASLPSEVPDGFAEILSAGWTVWCRTPKTRGRIRRNRWRRSRRPSRSLASTRQSWWTVTPELSPATVACWLRASWACRRFRSWCWIT